MPEVRKKSKATSTRADLIGGEQHRLLQADDRRKLDRKIAQTEIEIVPVSLLKPNARNAKRHPETQIALLSESIKKFGFTQPILIDEGGLILCGHGRFLAAKKAGVSHLPTIRLTYLSSLEKRALALADNKIAELGEWDLTIVSEELEVLFSPETELDFDPRITGYETVEVDRMLTEVASIAKPDPADYILQPSSHAATTLLGDIWICGRHRLICANALDESSYVAVLGNDRADICFTDPPYNVPNAGHVTGRDDVREFAMAAGEMSFDQFVQFLGNICKHIASFCSAGAVVYICIDWRHLQELRLAADPQFGEPRNLIVWVKTNAGMGTFYRSQHELILVCSVPGGTNTNNFGLGGKGRYRTNVWRYPGCNSFGHGRDRALAMHPTVKPVAMVADALMDCSNRSDIVLDPFGGSGTTMIAAERTGRRARLIELDPIYCDVIVQRWQTISGKTALLLSTNETFDEVSLRRCNTHVGGD